MITTVMIQIIKIMDVMVLMLMAERAATAVVKTNVLLMSLISQSISMHMDMYITN